MPDRVLDNDAPAKEWQPAGHWCHYHGGRWGDIYCRNPLDCDVSVIYRLTDAQFRAELAREAEAVGDV